MLLRHLGLCVCSTRLPIAVSTSSISVNVLREVWNHRFVIVWRQNVMVVEGKVDAHIAEMGMVEGVEGMKTFRINLDGSVASQQSAIKEDVTLCGRALQIR